MTTRLGVRRTRELYALATLLLAACPARAQTPPTVFESVTVGHAKLLATGDSVAMSVEVWGVVTTVPDRVSADGYAFYIQDGTAGVRTLSEDRAVRSLGPGDSVRVLGRMGRFRGTPQLLGTQVEVIAQGLSPAALPVTVGEILRGGYEGLLVEVEATSTYREDTDEDDDIIVYIRSAGDQIRVDIPDEFYQQPLLADRIRDRRRLRIIGVVQTHESRRQRSDPIRIVPRAPSDLHFAPKPDRATLLGILAMGILAGLALHLALRRRAAERYLSELSRTAADLERSERALRQSESRFRGLVEHSFGMVLVIGRGYTVSYISAAARTLCEDCDIEPHSLRSWFRRIHPADRRAVAAELRRMRVDVLARVDFRIGSETAGYRHIGAGLSHHLDNPAILGIVVHARDITAHRLAEQALVEMKERLDQAQRLDAIGRLAGGVAHDFNNLLTVISGNATMLSEFIGPQDPGCEELRQIRVGADRAAEMTRKLLTFGRHNVEGGECVDVGATLREIEGVVRRLIPEHIALSFDIPQSEFLITADMANVEQVLLNLLLNARDAVSEHGSVRVSVQPVELKQQIHCQTGVLPEGSYVQISVEDDGIGMDETTLRRLFEPYFTTKQLGQGTGLGLATVYGIVSECGGQIQVSSRLGVGTTIEVFFPRSVQTPLPPKPAGAIQRIGSGTVLVVEDEEQVRNYIRRVLTRAGYDVLDADSGEAALELLDSAGRQPDAVLTDVIMPGMTGPQLAAEIRARWPDVRIMFMSGYAADALPADAQLRAVATFREKPFSPSELLQALEELLGVSDLVLQ